MQIKPVANGFQISYPNGKMESIPLSKVLKIFLSDDVPKSARIPEANSKTEIANTDAFPTKDLSEAKQKKSSVAVFSEGLIPGWSRMVRSDSYSVKGLGFLFIFAELYLAQKIYFYTKAPGPVSDPNHPNLPSQSVLVAFALRDSNLLNIALLNNVYSDSKKVRLEDGQVMQKGRYVQEREAYVSAFVFILLLDAFLGYRFEDWSFVPNVNVSVQNRNISAGITIRF
ncbi:DNA-binding protein [Leptospira stimsonii]|uniref:DNA-binding protein n=1 Tax=Leptospira stimsonii TaxID=2202203 RepID=A0ABY2N3I1_9LEPT|nr:DNA-binding protein [Leptospira stimsonii]TGK26113.1 DNA-binding protein [Leptospira stimsonii]TGM14941.1 DNA-binding protein [Leptospira stimsonii]